MTKAELNLMPPPAHVMLGQGKRKIDQSFRIAFTGYRELRLESAAERLAQNLEWKTGMPLSRQLSTDAAGASLGRKTRRSRDSLNHDAVIGLA